MKEISVLMSVYSKERPDYLKAALDSVFNQTVPPSEVVLVEDGLLPNELEAVVCDYEKAHREMKVVRCAENRGLGRALNTGLKHCSCELVARMDTDDISMPHRFERQLEIFEEHPEVDVCSAWMSEFEVSPDKLTAIKRLPETSDELYEYGKRRNPVNHPVVMFRKRGVMENGSYRDYPLFEDYFLWVRMITNGCHFYTIQEPLLYFRASHEMYARRGGWQYAFIEARLQFLFYGLRYIGVKIFLQNLIVRFITRVMPRKLRAWLYKKRLRNRNWNSSPASGVNIVTE